LPEGKKKKKGADAREEESFRVGASKTFPLRKEIRLRKKKAAARNHEKKKSTQDRRGDAFNGKRPALLEPGKKEGRSGSAPSLTREGKKEQYRGEEKEKRADILLPRSCEPSPLQRKKKDTLQAGERDPRRGKDPLLLSEKKALGSRSPLGREKKNGER